MSDKKLSRRELIKLAGRATLATALTPAALSARAESPQIKAGEAAEVKSEATAEQVVDALAVIPPQATWAEALVGADRDAASRAIGARQSLVSTGRRKTRNSAVIPTMRPASPIRSRILRSTAG